MEGYRANRSSRFDYGTSLPDLRPGVPVLATGGKITRTLTAVVNNTGGGASGAGTVRFYDGNPAQSGTIIGSSSLPALAAGGQGTASVVWDVQGKGGEHRLYVTVDPAGEYDEGNNGAQSAVVLPRLDEGVTPPGSVTAGGTVTVGVRLENLQGSAILPVTISVTIRSPLGMAVYSQTVSLSMAGGEIRDLNAAWQSDTGAETGVYAVVAESVDAYGGRVVRSGSFTLSPQPAAVPPVYRVFLPAVLRSHTGGW